MAFGHGRLYDGTVCALVCIVCAGAGASVCVHAYLFIESDSVSVRVPAAVRTGRGGRAWVLMIRRV